MMFYTHLAFAFLTGILGIKYLHPQNQILFIFLLLFAAALPDIDSPSSKLGSKVKVIGWLFSHRGFFHSILALLLFSLLGFYFLHNKMYFYAIAIGYGSHLLSDMISKQGIMLFYPFSKKKMNGFVTTGGFLEMIFLLIFIAAGIWLLMSF